MCLTRNAHPHRKWGYASPGMHIVYVGVLLELIPLMVSKSINSSYHNSLLISLDPELLIHWSHFNNCKFLDKNVGLSLRDYRAGWLCSVTFNLLTHTK